MCHMIWTRAITLSKVGQPEQHAQSTCNVLKQQHQQTITLNMQVQQMLSEHLL